MADKWVILVGGYGAFLFEGSEVEAEEMRAHKARWERGVGKKRPATEEEIATGKASQCWNHVWFKNRRTYNCHCPDEHCVAEAGERMENDCA